MLFNSAAFALFLPVMLATYWSLRGSGRRWSLLIGSYFFYAWWDWRFCSLLALSTLVDYGCARAIERADVRSRKKSLLLLSIGTNLGVLATFKYFNFFSDGAATLLSTFGITGDLPTLNVILPMGISFYTFQTMSYTIDVYRGAKAERNLLNFAVFVSCFPQLVAGPIVRSKTLLPQLREQKTFATTDFSTGVFRLFRGLFKKMVIADTLALYVDVVFADPAGYTGISAWIALYAYAFQIYMDFSGYTDCAIGIGHMLGLRFPENFNSPYLASSPSDFWKRWHITLSTWLRDYLYIPLGGSKLGRWFTVRNLFITMALGGLWHGAAWTFVAWGIYHAALLIGEHIIGKRSSTERDRARSLPERIVRVGLMFHATCLGWLLFRAQDWGTVTSMLSSLTDFTPAPVHGKRIALIVLACAAVHCHPIFKDLGRRFGQLPSAAQGALAGACCWLLFIISPSEQAFIYFQF
jgi:alginate O-acetyltransferase complex protein AlgI